MGSVARHQVAGSRLLPAWDFNPYQAEAGHSLIRELGQRGRALSASQRRNARMEGVSAIIRLFWLHEQAVNSEVAGRATRANFWWNEWQVQWQRLTPEHPAWATATQLFATIGESTGAVHRRLAAEWFIDAHLALYNGHETASSHHARWHLDRAVELLPAAGLSAADEADLRLQVKIPELRAWVERGQWCELEQRLAGEKPFTGLEELLTYVRQQRLQQLQARGELREAAVTACSLLELFPEDPAFRHQAIQVTRQCYEQAINASNEQDALAAARNLAAALPADAALRDWWCKTRRAALENALAQGRSKEAWRMAASILEEEPHEVRLAERICNQFVDAALGKVRGLDEECSEPESLKDAEAIGNAIQQMRSFRSQLPDCWPAYSALGVLYLMQAVRLHRGGRPTKALEALAKSTVYQPGNQQTAEFETAILSNLSSLRSELSKLGQGAGIDLLTVPASQLSHPALQGLRPYVDEVRTGTKLRDAFLRSAEAREIPPRYQRARARHFWLKAGLPRLADDDGWDDRALAFDRATDLFFGRSRDEDPSDVWSRVKQELLTDEPLDIEIWHLVQLASRDEPWTSTHLPPMPEFADSESSQSPFLSVPLPLASDDRPVYRLAVSEALDARDTDMPADFWWFSSRDKRSKLVALSALAALIVAVLLLGWDTYQRGERRAAFAELAGSYQSLDVDRARTAIARYRSARPLALVDEREAVVQQFEEALPTWSARRQRNEAFEKLQTALAAENDLSILASAEAFLQAQQPHDADQRRDFVVEEYRKTFLRWILAQPGSLDADAQAHVDLFRTLVPAISNEGSSI